MVNVKICKNCGHESEEGKIRCSYCGYLFEDEMDSVLREMNLNLNNFKQELSAPKQPSAVQPAANQAAAYAQPAENQSVTYVQPTANQAAAYVQHAESSAREQEALKLEVANLKGQLTALQGELGRLSMQHAVNNAPQSQYVYQPAPAQPAYYANTYGYSVPAEGVYSQAPQQSNAVASVPVEDKPMKRARKTSRIVLAVLSTLLLAASIAVFFFAWIKDSFTGFEGIKYLFGIKGGDNFGAYLLVIRAHDFAGKAAIAKICLNFCYYVVKFGVVVYAALLVLSFPILFSLGGRIRFKAWHACFAWLSLIVALLLFGVFCWVSGFSAITYFFLGGAAANLLRVIFLFFYK